jgi:DNA-binding CsgD family transcriptional regulator
MSAKKVSVTGLPAADPVAHKSLTNRPQCRPGAAMLSDDAWGEIARSLKLSGRELQIVRGIFDDETDLGIAGQLGISLHTVHTHVERLHRKLAIMNRSQLLLLVMREFLTLTVSQENDLPPICANRASRCYPFGP